MRRRENKVFIEKYFKIINNRAACRLCSNSLKSDRTFNLKTHVMKIHNIKDIEIVKKQRRINNISSNTPPRKIPTIKIEINKKELIRSYIGLVIEDGMSFDILNSENFKDIIQPICRGLTSKTETDFILNSRKCKEVIQLVTNNIRNDIKTKLKQRFLSLKLDTVSSSLLSNIICISAQYIENDEIQSQQLGIEELENESNLTSQIVNTLTKYDINLSQIVSITRDRCYEVNNITTVDVSPKVIFHDIEICPYAANIAQFCALDVTKNCEEVKNFHTCCRNLVKFIKNPCNGYTEIFYYKNLIMPQLDCPTRWGSTFNMIKQLKNAKDVLVEIFPIKNEFRDEHFELNDNFWDVAEAYCIAFEPLQNTIEKFQQEPLHYGDFYAEWLKCKKYTENISNSTKTTYVGKIASNLLQKMESRTSELLLNEQFISCLYLDPRFNYTLTSMQKFSATSHLKKLYERIKCTDMSSNTTQSDFRLQQTEGENFFKMADELLKEYLTRDFVPAINENYDVIAKIKNLKLPCLRVDSNVLHFWRDKQSTFPEIYNLSKICFAVPATQKTMESTFLTLAPIMDKNSGRSDKDLLENILLVKSNTIYLNQAIDELPLFEDEG